MNANLPQLQPFTFIVVAPLLNWWFASYIFFCANTLLKRWLSSNKRSPKEYCSDTDFSFCCNTSIHIQCNHRPVQNNCNGAYHRLLGIHDGGRRSARSFYAWYRAALPIAGERRRQSCFNYLPRWTHDGPIFRQLARKRKGSILNLYSSYVGRLICTKEGDIKSN